MVDDYEWKFSLSCSRPFHFPRRSENRVATRLCPGVSTLEFSKGQGERLSSVLMCSAVKMCSAIFTSCSERSCVSCPLTKQKLTDLIQLRERRLGKVSNAQIRLTALQCSRPILMRCKVFECGRIFGGKLDLYNENWPKYFTQRVVLWRAAFKGRPLPSPPPSVVKNMVSTWEHLEALCLKV